MRIRALAAALLAALALTAVVTAAAPASAAAARRPNIVFILTDDLSWNLVRYMPHVRAMERHGVTFRRYIVSNSLCCPSRASIFTGQYPHDSRVLSNLPPTGGFEAFLSSGDETHTYATSLQGAGYRTAMMGKYMNDYQPRFTPGSPTGYVPPGWTEWDVTGNGYPGFNYALNVNGTAVRHGRYAEDYLNDVLSARGTNFIDAAAGAGKPFALEIASFTPHLPYTPAPRDDHSFPGLTAPRPRSFNRRVANAPDWLGRRPLLGPQQIADIDTGFRQRVRAVQSVDDMIGEIERMLRTHGLEDDTYIVFSSDNGYHMGEHALAPGKQTAFDTDISVPLIVTGPHVRRGRTVTRLAQNVDLRPTFDRLAHVGFRRSIVDGQSLVPFLRGHRKRLWRKAALIEHVGPDNDPSDPDSQGRASGVPPSYEALRLPNETYVEYRSGAHEYYNLVADPLEMTNTYGRLSDARKARLHRLLVALERCHGTGSCLKASRTP